jgi:hypothetical protein
MSTCQSTLVLQKSQAHHFTFAVLRELAFFYNETYGYAFPSLERLAERLHVCVRTVQRHILKLEKMGELIVERVHGRGLNNRYYLAVCGIFPQPKKHDRWKWVRDALNRVWLQPAKLIKENMTPIWPYTDGVKKRQTGQKCAGYPQPGQSPRWCPFHRYSHFAPLK